MLIHGKTLTRRHYTRLRWYFRGCDTQGMPSRADNIDLDLAAAGLISRREYSYSGVVSYAITPLGEKELAAEKEREITRRRPHHDLASRLAFWLQESGRITWENIELLIPHKAGGQTAVRPDVFSMAATYNEKRINPCVHEVKVSRADFLCDLAKPQKREGYMQIAEVFYYVAPAGIIAPNEVPKNCGLVTESEPGNFKVIKKPRKQRVTLDPYIFMNLILKPGTVKPLF